MNMNCELKWLLIRRYGTETRAAKEIGISGYKISSLIRQRRAPTYYELLKLSRVFSHYALRRCFGSLRPAPGRRYTKAPIGKRKGKPIRAAVNE